MSDAETQGGIRRVKIFDQVAPTVARLWSHLPTHYVCPLCLQPFDRIDARKGVLTLEHVPPEWFGGRELILTCKDCNSGAGHGLDHLAKTREDLDALLTGDSRRAHTATFTSKQADGTPQRVTIEIERRGDAFLAFGVTKANNPAVLKAWEEDFERRRVEDDWDGHTFQVTPRDRYDKRGSDLAWLKSAYLAAFAALGYTYITLDHLEPVRKQILAPETSTVPVAKALDNGAPDGLRKIGWVREPAACRGVYVQMGRHVVLLPTIGPSAAEIHGAMKEMFARANRRLNVSTEAFAWPDRPVLYLDNLPDDEPAT